MLSHSLLLRVSCFVGYIALTSCVAAPIEEAHIFNEGAKSVEAGGDALFDKLAQSEKSEKLLALRAGVVNSRSFHVADAYYYSSNGEPPLTNEFRKAIHVVVIYAELLESLINGANNNKNKALLLDIATDLSSLTSAPGIAVAANALAPIVDQALLVNSRSEARSLAIRGAPAVSNLIAALRNATPAMFDMLTPAIIRTGGVNSKQFSEYQTVLGNYVVLLDRLQTSFDDLVAIYSHPSNQRTLESMAKNTGAIAEDASALRRTIAAIN